MACRAVRSRLRPNRAHNDSGHTVQSGWHALHGTLTIHWSTFDASQLRHHRAAEQERTDVNGNLQVQLVPNAGAQAPANIYTVHYQSDGASSSAETWTVPPSTQALRVAEVRTGMIDRQSGGTRATRRRSWNPAVIRSCGGSRQRPIKGPGFGTGSVAVINQNGQIETAVGNMGDCVYVDGTRALRRAGCDLLRRGDAGGTGGWREHYVHADRIRPAVEPDAVSQRSVYESGGFDYTLTGSTHPFLPGAAAAADTLVATYRIDPSADIGNLAGRSRTAL